MQIRYYKEFTIRDWETHGISGLNRKHYNIRTQNHNVNVLDDVSYNGKNLRMIWTITPTFAGGSKAVKAFTVTGNETTAKNYRIEILFVDVADELKDWKELSHKDRIQRVLRLVNTHENVKFHSTDPSFLGQGAWYRMARNGSAIYKFPGKYTDKGVWGGRHNNNDFYVTKHLVAVFKVVRFNLDPMVKAINVYFKVK